MTPARITREAELISKAAVYHAVQQVLAAPITATHDQRWRKLNQIMKVRA